MDGSILVDTLGLTGRDLKKAMTSMKLVVERRNIIPALGMALIRAGSRTIIATDMDQQLTVPFGNEGSLAATVLAPVDDLSRIARTFANQEAVTLTSAAEQQGGWKPVSLGYDGGSASLSGLNPVDFPVMAFETGKVKPFEIDAQSFAQNVRRLQPCISLEETRYYLNGIDIRTIEEPEGRVIRLCATDSHRLGLRLIRGLAGLPEFDSRIIPHRTIKTLLAVIGSQQGMLHIDIGDGPRMRFRFGECELITKTIDGTFPDIARVLPNDNKNEVLLPRLECISAIRRVGAVDPGRFGPSIKFETSEGVGRFTAKNFDMGEASMRVAVSGSLPFAVGARSSYLLDVFQSLDGPTVIGVFGDDNKAPMKFIEPDQESAGLFVLMPMRI